MDQARVDLLRSVFKAIEPKDVEVILDGLTDDIVIDASRRIVDPVKYIGHDGVRSYSSFLAQTWRSQRVEPEEFIEAGDKIVIVLRLISTGRSSGLTVEARSAWVATFRQNKIARLSAYQTRGEALAAVALGDG
jgi:ketosteroid isomerase-like protein